MSNRRGVRVLIAEHDQSLMETIREPLEDAGFVIVGAARDLREAAQMAKPLRPDVILVSVDPPDREHVAAVRESQPCHPAPVVVVTARETPELRQWAVEAGVDAHPVNRDGVRGVQRAIDAVLARPNSLEQVRRTNDAPGPRAVEQEELVHLHRQIVESMQARMRQVAALNALGEMMNRTPDLDSALHTALDSAVELAGVDAGGILLLDSSGQELVLRAHVGASQSLIRTAKGATVDEGMMPQIMRSVTVVADFLTITEERRAAMQKEGLQFLVGVPLRSQENPVGVMLLASRSPRRLSEDENALLSALGNQIGLAVDGAHLRTQELRAAILEERQAMSRQMHDDIAQTLGYLGLQMDVVIGGPSLSDHADVRAELGKIRVAIDDAYDRVRDSITRLREDIPSHFDLRDALHEIVAKFRQRTGCTVVTEMAGDRPLHLAPLVAIQAAYIVGEALANTRKHAAADVVRLTLEDLGRAVEITVQDNGRGFRVDSAARSSRSGFGLRFMKERAQRIGGDLRIESQPGLGTRVVVNLPSS